MVVIIVMAPPGNRQIVANSSNRGARCWAAMQSPGTSHQWISETQMIAPFWVLRRPAGQSQSVHESMKQLRGLSYCHKASDVVPFTALHLLKGFSPSFACFMTFHQCLLLLNQVWPHGLGRLVPLLCGHSNGFRADLGLRLGGQRARRS